MPKSLAALDYWDRTEHPPMPAVDSFVEAARRWVAVQEAIANEASHPPYHQSVMARHQKEWPTLWAALGITTEDK